MLDHLVSTIHDLLNRFNDAEIILGGDRNDLDLAPVYNSVPGLKQIQTEPTHKRKTIDIVATTMWRQYKQAIVVDPVDVDKPGFGKPSDHKCILLYPIDDQTQIRTAQYVLKRVRPMPESGLQSFEAAVARIDPTPLGEIQDVDLLDSEILRLLLDIRETHLPQKVVKLRSTDKLFLTNELKIIDRKQKREYARRENQINLKN